MEHLSARAFGRNIEFARCWLGRSGRDGALDRRDWPDGQETLGPGSTRWPRRVGRDLGGRRRRRARRPQGRERRVALDAEQQTRAHHRLRRQRLDHLGRRRLLQPRRHRDARRRARRDGGLRKGHRRAHARRRQRCDRAGLSAAVLLHGALLRGVLCGRDGPRQLGRYEFDDVRDRQHQRRQRHTALRRRPNLAAAPAARGLHQHQPRQRR